MRPSRPDNLRDELSRLVATFSAARSGDSRRAAAESLASTLYRHGVKVVAADFDLTILTNHSGAAEAVGGDSWTSSFQTQRQRGVSWV